MIIDNHKQLAGLIAGKRILHLSSFGKDSIVCLEWLANFAQCEVVSLNCAFLAAHPSDEMYLKYLKRRYPSVAFISEPNTFELNLFGYGIYQSPIDVLKEFNAWEHYAFDFWVMAEELRVAHNCDYICVGQSKYESVTRASMFYKKGLCIDKKIYPIGFFTKQQIFDVIKSSGLKLHPVYKVSPCSLDHPSWYKMKDAFLAWPEYEAKMLANFPLLALDKYRYQKLFNMR